MAALPNYRCFRCGFWSYETPQHKCTPRPIAAHQPTKEAEK